MFEASCPLLKGDQKSYAHYLNYWICEYFYSSMMRTLERELLHGLRMGLAVCVCSVALNSQHLDAGTIVVHAVLWVFFSYLIKFTLKYYKMYKLHVISHCLKKFRLYAVNVPPTRHTWHMMIVKLTVSVISAAIYWENKKDKRHILKW